jgi:hypothetical protein
MNYKNQLVNAIERTRNNGINVKDFAIESASYPIINERNKKELQQLFEEYVYNESYEVETQCIYHSWNVQDFVAQILNCDVLLTLGFLVIDNQKWFYSHEGDILQWNSLPINFRRSIHAWLTLPSLEIIDITLPATTLQMTKSENFHWNSKVFLHCRPDDYYNKPNRIYHNPQFVDNEFLERASLLKYTANG